MKFRTKIVLTVAVVFVLLLKLTPLFISNQIEQAFVHVDESLKSSYISDSAKLRLHIDSLCHFSPEQTEKVNAIVDHNRKIVDLIDYLYTQIQLKKISNDDLDIVEALLMKNAMGDTLFQKLNMHLLMAENLANDDSSKKYFLAQRALLMLDEGKFVSMNRHFHLVPAIGGMTSLTFFKNKTQEITLTALHAPAKISTSSDF